MIQESSATFHDTTQARLCDSSNIDRSKEDNSVELSDLVDSFLVEDDHSEDDNSVEVADLVDLFLVEDEDRSVNKEERSDSDFNSENC